MAAYKQYIPCDIYKRGITVFLGSYDELLKYVKEIYIDKDDDDDIEFYNSLKNSRGGAADTHMGDGYAIVRLPKFPETPYEIADAEHELLHATFWMLDYCGVQESSPYEAHTYLLSWLTLNALTKDRYEEIIYEEKNN